MLRREAGYSLAELLIAVGIIGIIAATGMVSLRGISGLKQKMEINSAASLLVSDIRWLQQKAMNSENPQLYRIQFMTTANPQYYSINEGVNSIRQVRYGPAGVADVVIEPSALQIEFSRTGAPATGYTIYLKHAANAAVKQEISVLPATGRVMLK